MNVDMEALDWVSAIASTPSSSGPPPGQPVPLVRDSGDTEPGDTVHELVRGNSSLVQ